MTYVNRVGKALLVLGTIFLNIGSVLSVVKAGEPIFNVVAPIHQAPGMRVQPEPDVPIYQAPGIIAVVKNILNDWLGERASWKSRVGIAIALGALAGLAGKMVGSTYNPIPGFTGIAVASYITNPTTQVAALGALISLAGKMVGSAYKTIPAFKGMIDSSVQSASDFINDIKDGNGNARRNAQIGIVSVAAAIVGYYNLLSSGEAIQGAMQ